MEGLSKKAFDFTQFSHIYDMVHHLDPHIIKHTLTGMASGGTMEGTKRWFGRRGANLLNSGIEMGKNNQQMSPFTSTFAHNFIGKSRINPYHEGIQIGNSIREKGLTGEDELKHIDSIVSQKVAEKDQLEAAGKKVKDPTLKAFDNYQTGSFRHNKVFNSMINAHPISQDEKGLAQKAIAHSISAPIAKLMDPSAIARPIIAKAESIPAVSSKINKAFPEGTKRGTAYSKVRNYID